MVSPREGYSDGLLGPRFPCPCRFHRAARSEEHTSELQSRSDLVCRLLLEKKKKIRLLATKWEVRKIKNSQKIGGKDGPNSKNRSSYIATAKSCKLRRERCRRHRNTFLRAR